MTVQRPTRSLLIGAGLLLATLWSAAGLAVGAPDQTSIDLAGWRGPSYAKDVGSVSPISLALAEELTGLSLLQPAAEHVTAPIGGGDPVAPLPIETPVIDPGKHPKPILIVAISARPKRVNVGKQIDYHVAAKNIGNATATEVVLESQVPNHTTFGTISCETFLPEPTYQCVDVPPYPPPFPLTLDAGTLRPGETTTWDFTVTVVSYPTTPPEGYVLNFASAFAKDHPTVHSTTVRTRVDPP